MKKMILVLVVALSFVAGNALAGPFDGWTLLQDDDGPVDPGAGGEYFDAEYLYANLTGTVLSIGLQTGFDVVDGTQDVGGDNFTAGDLALTFSYDSSSPVSWDYGFKYDFTSASKNGMLYEVSTWNDPAPYSVSGPHTIDSGTVVSDSSANPYATYAGSIDSSYYRIASFDLQGLIESGLVLDSAVLGVHWTMSCGNDVIEAFGKEVKDIPPVPEPATMLLLGSGLIGLAFYRRKMKK